MRRFCILTALTTALLMPTAAIAQSEGAIVTRGFAAWEISWVEWDGNNTLVVYSDYPDFGCEGAEAAGYRWQTVTTPVGAQHYHDNGMTFARVYDATYDELDADPYEFICGSTYMPWAEGTVNAMFYENQADPAAPGASVWGHVLNGTLADLTGTCQSGVVKVEVVHMLRIGPHGDSIEFRTFKGPTAQCVGKQ